MTPERWAQIEDLFHAAHALLPDARARFLEETCGNDIDLRREVESLLNEPASRDGFLAQPALVRGAQMLSGPPPSTLAGRSVGRYQLQSLIGAGGMGEVYRSHDATLCRDVAVKVLPPGFTKDPDRLARLEREARMLASLNHPNICGIYGIEEAEGVRLLLLEFVDGETLADKLQRESNARAGSRGLPLAEALAIARQLAEALEAAHEKGIVHRDLKPANIKITPDGVVKVLDFGLAKLIGGGTSAELTQVSSTPAGDGADGAVIGTAAYMSPEQARGARVDSRTDIWSFGCVLFEMLTGRLAFAGATSSDMIAKILEREPEWSALPPDTPPGIRRVLRRCLVKDARRRVRDIGDVRIEIDSIDEELPAILTTPLATRSRLALWLPWTALLAMGAAFAVIESRRPAQPTSPIAGATFSYLTDWKGTESAAEISPDGKFVAFLSDRAGEFDIWLIQIGTGKPWNVTLDVPPLDGPSRLRSFGFTAEGEVWFTPPSAGGVAGQKLLIPIRGGVEGARPLLGSTSVAPSWSADGSRMVFFNNVQGDPLFIADRAAADATPLLSPDPSSWPHTHNPVWSPDDLWIYFTRGFLYGLNETDEMDIWRIRPGGGEPERMTETNTDITFTAVLDPRTVLYVGRSGDRSGPWLWTLDTQTKVRQRISAGLEQYTSVAASHDGRRIVATLARPVTRLWTLPLDRVADERDVKPYDVPSSDAIAPRFGAASLFYLSSTPTEALFRLQQGVHSEIWTGSEGTLSEAPAVSRDGQRVAVMVRREGKQRLSIMSADGTGRRALATSIATQGSADWAPDGQWIVVGGRDPRGWGLFKVPVNGGEPVRLASERATSPVWSPDGELIVYGGQLVAGQVEVKAVRPDGTTVSIERVLASPAGYRFMPAGKRLIYLPRTRTLDFWSLDLATGDNRQITRLNDQGRLRTFDITPDGKQLVFDRSHENGDIVLIQRPGK